MAAARSFRFLRPVAVRFRLSYLVSLFFKFKFKFEIRMGCVMLSYIEFIFICYMKALRGIKSSVWSCSCAVRSGQRPAITAAVFRYILVKIKHKNESFRSKGRPNNAILKMMLSGRDPLTAVHLPKRQERSECNRQR